MPCHPRLGVSTDYLLTGRETAPVDIAGAIRGDHRLSPAAKRHLIGIIGELQRTRLSRGSGRGVQGRVCRGPWKRSGAGAPLAVAPGETRWLALSIE